MTLVSPAGRPHPPPRASRAATRPAETTGLAPRVPTRVAAPGVTLVEGGHIGHRLSESASSRSFLALGVDPRKLDRTVDLLTARFDARPIDVTAVLIEAMHRAATEVNLPWNTVRAADAAPANTRAAEGLAVLVQKALQSVHAAVESALAESAGPVLLTEVAPLARYGHLGTLGRWTDLSAPRPRAIWVLVPQLAGSQGATIDDRPLPLAAPGQYLRLENDWIDAQATIAAAEGV